MSDEIEFSDRYRALGVPYPDPDTVCKGQCEGLGVYPVLTENIEDDAVFVTCEDCGGTGRQRP